MPKSSFQRKVQIPAASIDLPASSLREWWLSLGSRPQLTRWHLLLAHASAVADIVACSSPAAVAAASKWSCHVQQASSQALHWPAFAIGTSVTGACREEGLESWYIVHMLAWPEHFQIVYFKLQIYTHDMACMFLGFYVHVCREPARTLQKPTESPLLSQTESFILLLSRFVRVCCSTRQPV